MEHGLTSVSLVNSKNQGGLVIPSKNVISVVRLSEKLFNFHVIGIDTSKLKISSDKLLTRKLLTSLNNIVVDKKLFFNLKDHDVEVSIIDEDFPSTQLIKKISEYHQSS